MSSVGWPELTSTFLVTRNCSVRYIAAPYKPRIKHNKVYVSCYFATMEDPGPEAVPPSTLNPQPSTLTPEP